jgi:hypothetical protein
VTVAAAARICNEYASTRGHMTGKAPIRSSRPVGLSKGLLGRIQIDWGAHAECGQLHVNGAGMCYSRHRLYSKHSCRDHWLVWVAHTEDVVGAQLSRDAAGAGLAAVPSKL